MISNVPQRTIKDSDSKLEKGKNAVLEAHLIDLTFNL